MNNSEALFWQLLEARGLMQGRDFWFDEGIFEANELPRLGPVPDFLIKNRGQKLLIEVKELQGAGPRKPGRNFQSFNPMQFQAALVDPLERAKRQLKPYALSLGIPTMVVFFDTNGTHLLDRHILELLFGEMRFWIMHDPKTGIGGEIIPSRGKGQRLNREVGTYISAVGVIGCSLVDGFVAWANQDPSLAEMRIRILRNPYASVHAHLNIFNSPKDEIYV